MIMIYLTIYIIKDVSMNMTKNIIFLSMLCIMHSLVAESFTLDSNTQAQRPIFNVNFNNYQNLKNDTTTTTNTSVQVSTKITWLTTIKNKVNDIPLDLLKQYAQGCMKNSQNYLINHKKLAGSACVGAGYSYTLYKLFSAHRYLSNNERWSAWKKELSLKALLYAPEIELADELLLEIQQRYLNPANPTDFLSPLVDFMRDIEEEIEIMKGYDKLYTVLNRLYFLQFFPLIKFNKIQKSGEKVQRLVHLKHIFQLWAAGHNVQMNKPKKKKSMFTKARRLLFG